ncbi:MAG: flagellum-specific ATP synthase FliI, partial [Deltaproteobacteria bacterium]|nr:flagellum-specific ATP synthase FliI [Deltaproteobacteria bacterium]
YTVLVEGDDMNEPVADTVRSILDGHIVLSRRLAAKNHYPAIDILHSASRVMRDVISSEHLQNSGRMRELMATYQENEELINIGAYRKGSNAKIDQALARIEAINRFLRQPMHERVTLETTLKEMAQVLGPAD